MDHSPEIIYRCEERKMNHEIQCSVVKIKRRISENKKWKIVILVIATAIMLAVALPIFSANGNSPAASLLSKSTLEKIISASDLSTFEAVYNGIAKVMDSDNPEKVNYYVSYDAKVKAGIDFAQVQIEVDHRKKVISVQIPEVKITDISVVIESLDYIFMNNRANTSTVSEEAYKQCIADVTEEVKHEKAIYELAGQNAKNIVEALVRPFVNSLDSDYVLEIS